MEELLYKKIYVFTLLAKNILGTKSNNAIFESIIYFLTGKGIKIDISDELIDIAKSKCSRQNSVVDISNGIDILIGSLRKNNSNSTYSELIGLLLLIKNSINNDDPLKSLQESSSSISLLVPAIISENVPRSNNQTTIPITATRNENIKTSKIKVYIYDVISHDKLNRAKISENNITVIEHPPHEPTKNIKYKFGKFKDSTGKTDKSINPLPIPINNGTKTTSYGFGSFSKQTTVKKDFIFSNNKSDKTSFFSKNIIENSNSNNIKSKKTIENTNLIELYNKIYLKYPTRIILTEFILPRSTNEISKIYSGFPKLLNNGIKKLTEYLKTRFSENIQKYTQQIDPSDNSEIIYRVSCGIDEKIIVIGDLHGSFHSFFRVLSRLYINRIIKPNYKLAEGYRLIFLGDVVDRGNFAIEIMYIILNLIKENNTNYVLRVILNRGNHEEESTYRGYGFYNEMTKKISNRNINELFIEFYSYCPSAIILEHADSKYWLCHGGFNITRDTVGSGILNNTNWIYNNIGNESSQIRWNDFSIKQISEGGVRGSNDIYKIGTLDLNNFLSNNNIDFIIRGHTDNFANAMLLYYKGVLTKTTFPEQNKPYFVLNNIENRNYYETKKTTDLITYPLDINYTNLQRKTDEQIATLNTKKFSKNGSEVGDVKLYPVLTISNNSDIERYLYPDSYVIISI